MEFLGNKGILKNKKTGFLSSRKCPAEVVLKSYEWAKKQRAEANCVVCGNHSQIEQDVFDILLKLSLSENIVVGYKSSHGQLDRLLTNLKFDHV